MMGRYWVRIKTGLIVKEARVTRNMKREKT
jgi:hypothetical protein